MRAIAFALTSFALTFLPLQTRAESQSWFDLFNPDRIAENIVQYAIVAARTQADVIYEDLSIDLLGGRAVLSGLEVYPPTAWESDGNCAVLIDRMVLATAPIGDIANPQVKITLYGVDTHRDCFPPTTWRSFMRLALIKPHVPHMTLSIDYHVPSARAEVAAHVAIDRVATLDLTAEFDYLSLEGEEEPIPVAYLTRAALSVENLGAWAKVRSYVPASLRDPELASGTVRTGLTALLRNMSTDASASAPEAPTRLTMAQRYFVDEAVVAWEAFLADPQRLVLETTFAPEAPVYLDIQRWADAPGEVFDALVPRLTTARAGSASVLPLDMIRQALTGDHSSLSNEEKLRLGEALLTGVGAPRDLGAGTGILVGLARSGEAEAAALLSEAFEEREPRTAYRWALMAAAAGEAGGHARLDRLEGVLPFAEVLEVQALVEGDGPVDPAVLQSLAQVKAEARARLTGRGKPRHYEAAATFAMIAKAAGDLEGAALLDEVDQRLVRLGADALDAWRASEESASATAMEAWIGQDLPARFLRE
ncbi:MAG: hypothetical protein AAGB05_00595 [Pseudomonadota bacterium]